MPKTFDPNKFVTQAEEAVNASLKRQETLQKKVDTAQAKYDTAEKGLATAKENLDAEKKAQAVSQAYIDRNSNGVTVTPVAEELPPL